MPKPAGLYLHIPFCHSRCTYCSFVTGSYEESLAQAYLQSLRREIASTSSGRICDTLYLGGGTPSIVPPEEIATLIRVVRDNFHLTPDAEVTMEANPSDVDPRRLELYLSYGINRISLGIQSFIDTELERIGRDHTADQAERAFQSLRSAGFHNISLDLICGLPGQSCADWTYNLEKAFELEPEHISIYLLEVKEGSIIYAQIRSGRLTPPDEDLAAQMYEALLEQVDAHGYTQYEISNFCKTLDGQLKLSRHNLKYWTDQDYLGFGVSAHSYEAGTRRWNVSSTHEYIRRIQSGQRAVADSSTLSRDQSAQEAFMLQLRLAEGVDLAAFYKQYEIDVYQIHADRLKELEEDGLLELSKGRLRLTKRGILYSNEIFMLFI